MSEPKFNLTCESYKSELCGGLSLLQHNGEFVDMTLAADGHLVKVHQVVIALASPYIKELISAANCPHPVIFLSKISYSVLCAVLEYIYTGEVLVSKEDINEVIRVAKELRIKGLESLIMSTDSSNPYEKYAQNNVGITNVNEDDEDNMEYDSNEAAAADDNSIEEIKPGENLETADDNETGNEAEERDTTLETPTKEALDIIAKNSIQLQYTLTTQGRIQLILNRFLYCVNHTSQQTNRHWRCIDNKTKFKCPAYVYTQGDVMLRRAGIHNHPFHDKKILNKMRFGHIYATIEMADARGKQKMLESLMGKKNTDAEVS